MIVFNTFYLHLPIKLLYEVCLFDLFYRSKKNNCVNLMYFRYLDNKVFASLANGDLIVYKRDNGEYSSSFEF